MPQSTLRFDVLNSFSATKFVAAAARERFQENVPEVWVSTSVDEHVDGRVGQSEEPHGCSETQSATCHTFGFGAKQNERGFGFRVSTLRNLTFAN